MTVLVTGCTCAGKSSFIKRQGKWARDDIAFGFDLAKRDAPPDGVLHYNLLVTSAERMHAAATMPDWLERSHRRMVGLLDAGKIERAVVLVASREDLLARARLRQRPSVSARALPREDVMPLEDFWIDILASGGLEAAYRRLVEGLERRSVPFDVLCSTGTGRWRGNIAFHPCSSSDIKAVLRGTFPVPSKWFAGMAVPRRLFGGLGCLGT